MILIYSFVTPSNSRYVTVFLECTFSLHCEPNNRLYSHFIYHNRFEKDDVRRSERNRNLFSTCSVHVLTYRVLKELDTFC